MKSHSSGAVIGNSKIGGLAGQNSLEITDSYSTMNVSGDSSVGGLVGSNWKDYRGAYTDNQHYLTRCYSTGEVTGTKDIGGLVGKGSTDLATACFWDTRTSGLSTSAGGEGKTTDEMQTAITFLDAGWDFVDEIENGTEDIWWILEGQDYPRLWWEAE